ncbi:sensor domain-containing diguanylate cyclase [Sulfurimonas sp. CVO]|uniref:sensor domain-containing diguanylate cyclase n=1 Tax=Sulfurimonas sp. CVO TaxID=2283483 RepID=UPI00132EEE39|nr:sensor domain-containing diguanylate cyclase [Sulfurimonas sp. CVO]QHG91561.1 sensor domain-containing diguanylate cyclase [Sulfurimonas sp. CVO]
MKIKNSMYLFQIIFSLFIFFCLAISYTTYKNYYLNDLDEYIDKEIELYQKYLSSSLKLVSLKYEGNKNIFYNIHEKALQILKKNPDTDLATLKKELQNECKLKNFEIEAFLIDENYKIFDTTFTQDMGLNLSIIVEAKEYLDRTKKDGNIYIANNVSEDALDGKYKLYSYSKLKEGVFLELGFVDTEFHNNIFNALDKNLDLKLYRVTSVNGFQYYYDIAKRDSYISKKEYYQSLKKFDINKQSSDKIINTAREKKIIKDTQGKIIRVYVPILDYRKFVNSFWQYDIVISFDIDISKKIETLKKFENIIIIFLTFMFMFLTFMFYWLNKNFTQPIKEIENAMTASKLVDNIKNENEIGHIAQAYNKLLTNLHNKIKKNRELIRIDFLTKAKNRKAYHENVLELLSLYKRYQIPFSIMLFDIDNFKEVNDTYGHSVGDDVLKDITRLVKSEIRESDFLYRVGGEEFVVLFPQTSLQSAKKVAEKIRKIIQNNLNTIENRTITVSIGVCEVEADDIGDSLYKKVDQLLYKSKKSGKNRVCCE